MLLGVVPVKLVVYAGEDTELQKPLATRQAGLEIFRFSWM